MNNIPQICKLSFLILILIIKKTIQEDILVESNSPYTKCIEISTITLFCVDKQSSFVFNISTKQISNRQPFNFEHTDIKYEKSITIYYDKNNSKMFFFINQHLYKVNTQDFTIHSEFEMPLCNLHFGFSIINVSNDNFVLSCFTTSNELFLHLGSDERISDPISLISNFDCKPYEMDFTFICFYIVKENANPELISQLYDIATLLPLAEGERLEIENALYLNTLQIGETEYIICSATSDGKVICIKNKENAFQTKKEICSKIFTSFNSFTISPIESEYVFVGISGSIVNIVKFDKDLNINPIKVNYSINNGGQTNILSYLVLDKEFGAVVYDNFNNKNSYLHIISDYFCKDICYERKTNENEINLDISNYISGLIGFDTISSSLGTITSPVEGFKDNYIVDATVLSGKYTPNNANEINVDSFTYYSVNPFDTNTKSSSCTITIYNGEAGKCSPLTLTGCSVGYKFEGNCLPSCPSNTQQDDINHTCINCKTNNQYLLQDHCVDEIPGSHYVSDSSFNVLSICLSPCLSCKNSGNFCLSCIPNYKLSSDNSNTCVIETPDSVIEISTNLTIEEFVKEIEDYIKKYKNQTVLINGEGFTSQISNTSYLSDNNSTFPKIDFSKCESILKEHYKIPLSEQLTFVSIDIERETALTNQVEYTVYDSKGKKLDTSICNNLKVSVTYTIKNMSLINSTLAAYYAEYGIDIFDPDDPFFNDLCFPFQTENGTDITLQDRRQDIFQNLSLCEDNCEYDKINMEDSTVTCSCLIKKEINTKINLNFFSNAFISVFAYSNFGVVKCYKLLLDLEKLMLNLGFWFFMGLIVLHIPFLIWLFYQGLMPITRYLFMSKPNPKRHSKDDIIENTINDNIVINRKTKKLNTTNEKSSKEILDKIKNQEKEFGSPARSHLGSPVNSPKRRRRMLSFLREKSRSPTIKAILRENIGNDVIIMEDIENEENNTTVVGKKSSRKLVKISQLPNMRQLSQTNVTMDTANSGSNNQSPIRSYKKVLNSKNSLDSSAFFDLNSVSNQSYVYGRNNKRTFSTQSNSSISRELLEKNKNIKNNEYILSQEPIIKLHKLTRNNEDKESSNDDKVTIYSKDFLHSKENILLSKGTKTTDFNSVNSEANTVSNIDTKTKKIKSKITPSNDYLDDFDYESALLYDTRSLCKCYYLSLLTKQSILSTFVLKSPLELMPLRIILFIFSNAIDFAFNALFYMDSMISKRYNYEGKLGILFDLQNTIFSSLASTVVSLIITFLLTYLSNSKDKITSLEGLEKKNRKQYELSIIKILKKLKIKIFFCLFWELLLMIFFLYYVSCFCAVFKGSQFSWFQGGFTSFLLGMVIPFATSWGVVLLRKISLSCKCKSLFNFSIWLYSL